MSTPSVFPTFRKIPRLSRPIIITEKIDGTNAVIYIGEDGEFKTGSRNRWITPEDDNHGFSSWAYGNISELLSLGPGLHYGEWWGCGIQRGYGQASKRFSLFKSDNIPACCETVPILYSGNFSMEAVDATLAELEQSGSKCAPGFMHPEGIVLYHSAANVRFKKTIDDDDFAKGLIGSTCSRRPGRT